MDDTSRILTAEHARESGVDQPWEESNGAWWDWYLSLAAEDDGPVELVEVDPPAAVDPLGLAELEEELRTPYALDDADGARFRAEGYVKLPAVLSPGALAAGCFRIWARVGPTPRAFPR